MKKVISIILIFIIVISLSISISNISLATENLTIKTDNQTIQKNENFKIYINIGNIKVASYTLNIYFDNDKLEYISGPKNTNVVNNRIINVWYDQTGGKNTRQNQDIAVFEFKAKETGVVNFNLTGEFYDSNGSRINTNNTNENPTNISNSSLQINIIEKQENNIEPNAITGEDNNSLLKIMRLDKEGLIPEFSPDIKDYYFIADLDTNNLEVTAIPEATNANVQISGNQGLKEGLNTILIEVTSRDNTSKSVYTINATKTRDKEAANSNLETLAIENVMLEPIFDVSILNYKASVPNSTENLNVFAVPENINGKVEITGKDNLKEGDNLVKVRVTAPNGYSFKDYIVNVHRRTQEEDKIFEEEQIANSEKLNSIIDEKGLEFFSNEQEVENEEENKNNQIINYRTNFIVLGLILVVGVEIFVIKKKK